MGLSLRHEVLSLGLRDPFRIGRDEPGAAQLATTVIVELRDDRFPELVGVGEGFPSAYYGETPETMAAQQMQSIPFVRISGNKEFLTRNVPHYCIRTQRSEIHTIQIVGYLLVNHPHKSSTSY
jgi:hypothetical protein